MKITSFGHATILVEVDGTSILVDPWLTQRLDRFWVRNPPLPEGILEVLDRGIDFILLTHHHCDHLHYPSLRWLAERLAERDQLNEVEVLYPESGFPMFTSAGMGHLPVPLTLEKTGFTRFRSLRTGDEAELGPVQIRAFPSRVRFPEMSVLFQSTSASMLFCADAVEHPQTWEYFTSSNSPTLDVAFVPAHSIVPRNVLTERELQTSYEEAQASAVTIFDRYVSTMDATVTVPFACGWKVSAEDGNLDFCNSTMYPFTPVQARDRLSLLGRRGELMPPGATLSIDSPDVQSGTVPGVEVCADLEAAYGEITLDPATDIPAFDPLVDKTGVQTREVDDLVSALMDGFIGTDVWCNALERGRSYTIRVTDDKGQAARYVLNPGSGPSRVEDAGPLKHYVEIAASTLQSLLEGELLYGSSWGLWTSDVALLPAIFHHPRFNGMHLEKAISASPTTSISSAPGEGAQA